MRNQTIQRTVIAQAQNRIILWLACGHKISIGPIPKEGDFTVEGDISEGAEWPCRHCPDPPAADTRSRRDILRGQM